MSYSAWGGNKILIKYVTTIDQSNALAEKAIIILQVFSSFFKAKMQIYILQQKFISAFESQNHFLSPSISCWQC
jgi:hypothetical protein